MQQMQQYRQSSARVNGNKKGQTHLANVLVGDERVRVCGDRKTVMAFVRLALAERRAA